MESQAGTTETKNTLFVRRGRVRIRSEAGRRAHTLRMSMAATLGGRAA
jgi:hypothetical protein